MFLSYIWFLLCAHLITYFGSFWLYILNLLWSPTSVNLRLWSLELERTHPESTSVTFQSECSVQPLGTADPSWSASEMDFLFPPLTLLKEGPPIGLAPVETRTCSKNKAGKRIQGGCEVYSGWGSGSWQLTQLLLCPSVSRRSCSGHAKQRSQEHLGFSEWVSLTPRPFRR